MSYRVAILQSSYIPWRGTFALINRCDAFIFLNSVQFTRRDWRTRNQIKTPHGMAWLSVPVKQRGNYHAPIDAIRIADLRWAERHLQSIEHAYHRAAHFSETYPALRAAYRAAAGEVSLSAVNRSLTAAICDMLGILTPMTRDVDLLPRDSLIAMAPTERLVALASAAGASEYLSGPSAKAYLDVACFAKNRIEVVWMDYSGLPRYSQLWGDFEPHVSIVDTLLNLGVVGTRAALDSHAEIVAAGQERMD